LFVYELVVSARAQYLEREKETHRNRPFKHEVTLKGGVEAVRAGILPRKEPSVQTPPLHHKRAGLLRASARFRASKRNVGFWKQKHLEDVGRLAKEHAAAGKQYLEVRISDFVLEVLVSDFVLEVLVSDFVLDVLVSDFVLDVLISDFVLEVLVSDFVLEVLVSDFVLDVLISDSFLKFLFLISFFEVLISDWFSMSCF
jgi:hypothetical protein